MRAPRPHGVPLRHPGRSRQASWRWSSALHQRRVDGVILAPSAAPQRALDYLAEKQLPCVLIDRLRRRAVRPDRRREHRSDARADRSRRAHSAIAASATSPASPGLRRRSSASRRSRSRWRPTGFAFLPHYLVTGNADHSERNRVDACSPVACRSPPTALVTGNNLATIGVMRAIRERGLRVPEDISLVGFDDFEWADCFEPRLTLVAQPCAEIGRQAAALLVERIASVGRCAAGRCGSQATLQCPRILRGGRHERAAACRDRRRQALRRRAGAARRRFRSAGPARSTRCSARTAPASPR